MSQKNQHDTDGEYHWGLAWATVALLAFAMVLLFIPHARWFGVAVLAGYFLIVKNSIHRSIWTCSPQRTLETTRSLGEESSRDIHESKEDVRRDTPSAIPPG